MTPFFWLMTPLFKGHGDSRYMDRQQLGIVCIDFVPGMQEKNKQHPWSTSGDDHIVENEQTSNSMLKWQVVTGY